MSSHTEVGAHAGAGAVEGIAFHRLARVRPRYHWAKPLLTGVLGLAFYVALVVVVFAPFVALAAVYAPATLSAFLESTAGGPLRVRDAPWMLAVAAVSVILMLPALLLASRLAQGKGVGLLASVTGRLRMGWLARSFGLAAATVSVGFLASRACDAIAGVPLRLDFDNPDLSVLIAVVLLLIPFQAAAEEYVFRGYLMQLVGSWLTHPAFAILLPAPLFMFGHAYNVWGLLEVGAVAIVAGWLSWRTGGLEAAISVHIAHNLLGVGLDTVRVDTGGDEGAPVGVLITTVVLVAYALLADAWARKIGIDRRVPRSALHV